MLCDNTHKYPLLSDDEILNPQPTNKKSCRSETPGAGDILTWWYFNIPKKFNDNQIIVGQCFACGAKAFDLQRAHIVDVVENGSNHPANMHLLCPICHVQSEFVEYKYYWRWYDYKIKNEFDFGMRNLRSIMYARSHESI